MTIRWPEKVLRPKTFSLDLAARNLSAPASISGTSQVVSSGAGIWKAKLGEIAVASDNAVKCFRAIAGLLDGQAGAVLIPAYRTFNPMPEGAEELGLYDPVPFDDDAFFDDGTGFVSRVIDVQLTGAIIKGATSATIAINVAGQIEPSHRFSLGERLYQIRTITYSSPTAAAITFSPPAREAASAGDNLEFDDPVCKMRLATDAEMDIELQLNQYAFPSVNLVEAL